MRKSHKTIVCLRKSHKTIVCYRGVRDHSTNGSVPIEYLNNVLEYEYGNRKDFNAQDILQEGIYARVEMVRVTMPLQMSSGKAPTFTDIANHHHIAEDTRHYDPAYKEFEIVVLEELHIYSDTNNEPHLLTWDEKKERFTELFLKGYPEKLAYPDAYLSGL